MAASIQVPSSNPEEPVWYLIQLRCTNCQRVWDIAPGYPVGRCACGVREYEAA